MEYVSVTKFSARLTAVGLLYIILLAVGCSQSRPESSGLVGMVGVNRKFDATFGIGEIKAQGSYSAEVSTLLAQVAPSSQELLIKLTTVGDLFLAGVIDSETAALCVRQTYGIIPQQRMTEKVLSNRDAPEAEKIAAVSNLKAAIQKTNTEIPSEFPNDGKKRTLVADLDSARWETSTEGGTKVRFETYKSQISARVVNSNGIFNQGQIFLQGVNLRANQNYVVRLLVSSNRRAQLISKIHKPSPPNWESYQNPDMSYIDIEEGLNAVEAGFVAMESTPKARLTIYLGQLDQGAEITVHTCKLYAVE